MLRQAANEITSLRAELAAAIKERDEAREMRKRLDKRIHCQRKSNRDNWEIVEQRRKWLGSITAQRAYILMRERALRAEAELAAANERAEKAERERDGSYSQNEAIQALKTIGIDAAGATRDVCVALLNRAKSAETTIATLTEDRDRMRRAFAWVKATTTDPAISEAAAEALSPRPGQAGKERAKDGERGKE